MFKYCINCLEDAEEHECDRHVESLANQQRVRVTDIEIQTRREWREPSDYAHVHTNRINFHRESQEIGQRLNEETPNASLLNAHGLPSYNEVQQQNRTATEELPPRYEECLINIVLAEEMNVR